MSDDERSIEAPGDSDEEPLPPAEGQPGARWGGMPTPLRRPPPHAGLSDERASARNAGGDPTRKPARPAPAVEDSPHKAVADMSLEPPPPPSLFERDDAARARAAAGPVRERASTMADDVINAALASSAQARPPGPALNAGAVAMAPLARLQRQGAAPLRRPTATTGGQAIR